MSSTANAYPRPSRPDPSPGASPIAFRRELAVYNAHLIELLAYAGRYLIICGEEIQGPFDTSESAWQAGCVRYGPSPFLVMRVHGEPVFR